MTMLMIPLWPFIAAVLCVLAIVFGFFMLCDAGWKTSLLGTGLFAIIPLTCFFTIYGFCAYIGGV